MIAVLHNCRDLQEIAATWLAPSNQKLIKSLRPHDYYTLVLEKDQLKWDRMNAENATGLAKTTPTHAGHAPADASANTGQQGRQGAVK
jgi:hypothetical protein